MTMPVAMSMVQNNPADTMDFDGYFLQRMREFFGPDFDTLIFSDWPTQLAKGIPGRFVSV